MSDGFDKANQLSFIGRQFGMMSSHRPTKESKSTVTLMKNSTKPGAGSITVNHKFLGKIQQLQQWRRHERPFKIQKSPLSIFGPRKSFLLQQRSEGTCHSAVRSNKFPIISG